MRVVEAFKTLTNIKLGFYYGFYVSVIVEVLRLFITTTRF